MKFKRILKWIGLGLVGLLLGASLVSFLINRSLPDHSPVVDRLSDAEKARLLETDHLRRTLGDTVWPGWGELTIPFVVYNEAYAFCVAIPSPAAGWDFVYGEHQGGAWEMVPGDTYAGQVYYRQRLANPKENPQNFIARVGDVWAATMQTHEYSEVAFYQGFREQLPPVLREVFPYPLMWQLLNGGGIEGLVGGLAHEAFHVFEAESALKRVQAAENVAHLEGSYPFDDESQNQAWKDELDLLVSAVRAGSDSDARVLAERYLETRQARRAGLSADLVEYERQREWLEGLAKYAELQLGRAAAGGGYQPVPEILTVASFHGYDSRVRFWEQQLDEVTRMNTYRSEVRFYYSGFAQAALLDRLMPGWKEKAMDEGVFLDGLLAKALNQS